MKRNLFLLLLLFISLTASFAQCPHPVLYDMALTNTSASPVWVHCIDNAVDPDSFSLDLISPAPILNYTVDFGDGKTTSGTTWTANTSISHKYGLGKFIIIVTTTENGCTTTIQGTLINDRKPGAAAEPPTLGSSGCVPKSLRFKNITTNPSRYTRFEWNWGDGTKDLLGGDNIGQYITHTYVKGKSGCDMKVRITAYGLCDTSYAEYGPYNFWDIDTAAVQASQTVLCGGDSILFKDITKYNCNITQPRRIQWDLTDVGGPVTSWLAATAANRSKKAYIAGPPGSVYTVYLSDSNYCGISKSYVKVKIIAPPVAHLKAVKDSVCVGETALINNLSTGGADAFTWDFGDNSYGTVTSQATQSHVYKTAGTFRVKLKAFVGNSPLCVDTQSIKIVVLPAPVTNFNISQQDYCGNVPVTFTDNSTGNVSWSWDFGGGVSRTGKGPWTINFDPGAYYVSLSTGNVLGCKSSVSKTFFVYPSVKAGMYADTVCEGFSTSFFDTSSLNFGASCAAGFIVREQWNNISGTSVSSLTTNPAFLSAPSSTSVITSFLESAQNIGDNYGARIAGFICPPETGNYVFWISSDDDAELWLSTSANPGTKKKIAFVSPATAYRQWNKFPSQQSLSIALVKGQKYYIEVLHKEGTGSDHVSVGWQLPSGALERPIPATRLSPYQEGNDILSWAWDFGDGTGTSNLQNPIYKYKNGGTYTVKLSVSTGKCSSTDSFKVVVKKQPVAGFTLSDTVGCTPFSPEIVNTSTGASVFNWDFGDGVSSKEISPAHTFANNGSADQDYLINLTVTSANGCSNGIARKVTVHPGATPRFYYAPSGPQCSPANITFYNISSAAQPTNYKWYIEKDSIITNDTSFVYHFANTTSVIRQDTVRLVAITASGCVSEIKKPVFIFPQTDVQINIPSANGCHPFTVKFNTSAGVSFYDWDFGDGGYSSSSNPSHTFVNTSDKDTLYKVTLITKNAFLCADTSYTQILVHPQPAASAFDVIPNTITIPDTTVSLINNTSGSWNYHWSFGDGDTSDLKDPLKHYYYEPGTYSISLVVSAAGCADTSVKKITVLPGKPMLDIQGHGRGCSPLEVDFNILAKFTDTLTVDFGDGNKKTLYKPFPSVVSHSYLVPAFYQVKLSGKGPGGTGAVTNDSIIIVDASPLAMFTAKPKQVRLPDPVFFSNTSVNAVSFYWDFGDGEHSTDKNPFHAYKDPGVYDVVLVARNAGGCSDTMRVPAAAEVKEGGKIIVPNAFTPSLSGPSGGDIGSQGLNDVFYPLMDNFTEFSMLIYNRWGDLIFETHMPGVGWDGYFKGNLCKEDVYVYKIKGRIAGGEIQELVGDVTLIHK